ncbi:unnamed protein product [Clonostachys rhizophaga]|uniref:Uncharacterized protein n=1 Tax=Clonostachys rhizophaga TaxID=160324 RepID=A0A9N9UX39_9HYPO|nr:unnamed protein product [Clonostachys rhizophaga]
MVKCYLYGTWIPTIFMNLQVQKPSTHVFGAKTSPPGAARTRQRQLVPMKHTPDASTPQSGKTSGEREAVAKRTRFAWLLTDQRTLDE